MAAKRKASAPLPRTTGHSSNYLETLNRTRTASNPKLPPTNINVMLNHNSFQRRSRLQTNHGKSPVSLSPDDTIRFDYNVFLTTWQDQIKMRQYEKCEKYCREVIDKLMSSQQELQILHDGHDSHSKCSQPDQSQTVPAVEARTSTQFVDAEYAEEVGCTPVLSMLEYRSKVHFCLAYLLKKYFKRHDQAREQYEQSIQTDKENPGAHFNLANMLVDYYRDYETAQTHFERAIALEPTYALYRMTFAEFLWHDLKQYQSAAAQYEELIRFDELHQNEDIYFNYGLLLRDHLSNAAKALSQFERVLEINPDDADAKAECAYTVQLQQQQQLMEETPQPQAIGRPLGDAEVEKVLSLKAVNNPMESKQPEVISPITMIGSPITSPVENQQPPPTHRRGSFRRSQHEIATPVSKMSSVGSSEEAEETRYAFLYHQTVDEKGKLQMLLDQKSSREQAISDNLSRVRALLNGGDFRYELSMMAQNGANYVESHAKEAYRILEICNKIVNELDTIHVRKDERGNTTPLTPFLSQSKFRSSQSVSSNLSPNVDTPNIHQYEDRFVECVFALSAPFHHTNETVRIYAVISSMIHAWKRL